MFASLQNSNVYFKYKFYIHLLKSSSLSNLPYMHTTSYYDQLRLQIHLGSFE